MGADPNREIFLLLENIHHDTPKLPKLNTHLFWTDQKPTVHLLPGKNHCASCSETEEGCTEKKPQTGGRFAAAEVFIGNLTYVQFEIYWVLTYTRQSAGPQGNRP